MNRYILSTPHPQNNNNTNTPSMPPLAPAPNIVMATSTTTSTTTTTSVPQGSLPVTSLGENKMPNLTLSPKGCRAKTFPSQVNKMAAINYYKALGVGVEKSTALQQLRINLAPETPITSYEEKNILPLITGCNFYVQTNRDITHRSCLIWIPGVQGHVEQSLLLYVNQEGKKAILDIVNYQGFEQKRQELMGSNPDNHFTNAQIKELMTAAAYDLNGPSKKSRSALDELRSCIEVDEQRLQQKSTTSCCVIL